MSRLSAAAALHEAEASRCALEAWAGRPVRAFAYPYGTRAAVDAGAVDAVRAAGYRLAFTARHGAIGPGSDPWRLPRVKIEGGEGHWMFRRACRGGLDAWRWVDQNLWRLQVGAAATGSEP